MTFGILRLGDAVQRWLRHPEPSSSSQKSTIKKNKYHSLPHTTGGFSLHGDFAVGKVHFSFAALLNEQKCQNRQCRRLSASPRYWMVSKKKHKNTFPLSYFCMTKRRVQGGEATSERRRRDGVYQKSYKRAFPSLIYLSLSPRGDRCEQSALTVPL